MRKISIAVISEVYSSAKKVYFNKQTLTSEINNLTTIFDVKESSMADYIYAFKHMMNGNEYQRTINYDATKYYLENILNDFGYIYFNNAINALEHHINYYENLQKINMKKQRSLLKEFSMLKTNQVEFLYPDEIDDTTSNILEGAKKQIIVNAYERSSKARNECIEKYGYKCSICSFDFQKTYGEIGKNFIHVHHLKELHKIQGDYEVNPIKDLRPVCPNCHAMLHKKKPAYSIDEIKNYIDKQNS
jgi:5-methylcytosine-specific restriction protein A